ncbi:MAG: ATP-binding protein [Oligoflexia bacterium]|nr:ATP-binding protein [Oligoflexia bacterium]
MTKIREFPIRAKLLLLMSALVLVATGTYLALAVSLFKEDKVSLVYELNASNVKTLSAEVESGFLKIADKIKLLTQGHADEAWARAVFEAEPDLISYSLYRPGSEAGTWRRVASVRNSEYLKLYGLAPEEIDRVRERFPVPFAKVLAKGSWAANATMPGGAPIVTLALAVAIRDKDDAGEYVAVTDLRMDRLLKLLSEPGIATSYLVDAEGRVVAHPDASLVTSGATLADVPIVRDAVQSPVALRLHKFDWLGKAWLGAHSSVAIGGLSVISQVEEEQAFRAARLLIRKSVLFGLLFVTAALLVSGWMSRSFTVPLEQLLAATEKLARWEFAGTLHVKTRDEIARLARAFNSMASDLRGQRAQLDAHRTELELKVKERTAALEERQKQLSEAQESLIRTTRLASLGELAGVAAHEVLNPVNNMNIRLERIRKQLREAEESDLKLMNEIVSAWQKAYSSGGWKGLEGELLKASPDSGKPLVEEDFENLMGISRDLLKRLEEKSADLEFLGREIARVTRIINSMRSLSRVGGERKPLDVHLSLKDTEVALADAFQKRKIALVRDYGPEAREAYQVIADRDELVQVFSNLVRNGLQAVSAANRRAGEIRIATRRANAEAGARVEVRISDNGTGIPQGDLARIFEPTFTTKTVEEGTGLGLSISRRLVRAFGGDIEVEKTAEGEGTTFLVWFPAVP